MIDGFTHPLSPCESSPLSVLSGCTLYGAPLSAAFAATTLRTFRETAQHRTNRQMRRCRWPRRDARKAAELSTKSADCHPSKGQAESGLTVAFIHAQVRVGGIWLPSTKPIASQSKTTLRSWSCCCNATETPLTAFNRSTTEQNEGTRIEAHTARTSLALYRQQQLWN